MIYHFFTADRTHLCPSIIRSFAFIIDKTKHIFVIYQCDENNKGIYEKLENELNLTFIYVSNVGDFAQIVKNRYVHILLHSVNRDWLVSLIKKGYRDINAVNWGYIPSSRYPYWLFSLIHPMIAYSEQQIRTMVALMKPDEEPLKKYYKKTKVSTISYLSNTTRASDIERCINSGVKRTTDVPMVYVGNNPFSLPEYVELTNMYLKRFMDKVSVLYMLNYGLQKTSSYYELVSLVKDFKNVELDEIQHPFEQYVDYMNCCDIYICPKKRQTGLAAIHTCLQLGKKLFLTGGNYEWATKNLGCTVFNVSDIENMTFEEFVTPLDKETQKKNKKLVDEMLDIDKNAKRWLEYFNSIDFD